MSAAVYFWERIEAQRSPHGAVHSAHARSIHNQPLELLRRDEPGARLLQGATRMLWLHLQQHLQEHGLINPPPHPPFPSMSALW